MNFKVQINGQPWNVKDEVAASIESGEGPALVTIPNVPIVATGTYQLSTGEATFTHEDLVGYVNSVDDPAVKPARLKIGHMSEFGDGEPCFGKVLNPRLSEDGQTVIGDYVGVPAWLAEVLPVAYPSRSIEGALNATTATGKKHRLVVDAVSLLGVTLPGVSTLEDLAGAYGSEMPEGTTIESGDLITASQAINGSQGLREQIAAAVNVEDVRRSYYETLNAEQWGFWVREIQIDPNTLIVSDDESGDLFQVSFEVNGSEVTFGDPVQVEIQYVEKVSAGSAESGVNRKVAVFASRDESRDNTDKETEMDSKRIRASLGLPEDATDEEVFAEQARLRGLAASAEEDKGTEPASDESDEDDEGDEPESDEDGEDGDEDGPETKRVDAKVLEQLKRDAAEGVAARKEQLTERRENILAAAVKAGKISPKSKDAWRKKLMAAPEATEQELNELEAGLIPVKETPVEASAEAGDAGYDQSLFPEAGSAGSGLVTQEGN